MERHVLFSFAFVLPLALLYPVTISAQPPAPAPAQPAPAKPQNPSHPAPPQPPAKPPASFTPTLPQSPTDAPETGPIDIIKILQKAKRFSILIRLFKSTQLINQLNSQLITTKSGGLTVLAPDDGAFSALKAGFLNSLGDAQKIELLQFHVLPVYVSSSNFDTLTNPVRTLAGEDPKRLQFDVVSYGGSVNISTGVVNASLTNIVYMDKQLAMYQADKVLLPLDFFVPKASSPSPSPSLSPKPNKKKSSQDQESDEDVPNSEEKSSAVNFSYVQGNMLFSLGVALVVVTLMV